MLVLMIWILIVVLGGWVGLRSFLWSFHPSFDGQVTLGEMSAYVFTSLSFQLKPVLPERSPEWLEAMKELDAIDTLVGGAVHPQPQAIRRTTGPTTMDGYTEYVRNKDQVKRMIKDEATKRAVARQITKGGKTWADRTDTFGSVVKAIVTNIDSYVRVSIFQPADYDGWIVTVQALGPSYGIKIPAVPLVNLSSQDALAYLEKELRFAIDELKKGSNASVDSSPSSSETAGQVGPQTESVHPTENGGLRNEDCGSVRRIGSTSLGFDPYWDGSGNP